MNNIRITHFEAGRKSASISGLTQWDYGQVLEIHGLDLPPAVEVHFAFERAQEAITRIGTTIDKVTRVAIPEVFLEYNTLTPGSYGTFYAYVYVADKDAGQTEYTVKIGIVGRAKPEAFERPEDAELFKVAIEAVNESAIRASKSELSASEASLRADQSREDAALSAVQSAQSVLHADNSRQSAETAALQAIDALQDVETLQGRVNEDTLNVAGDRAEVEYLSEQVKADREQTGKNVETTGADRKQTGIDAVATAADREATALDRDATNADREAVSADKRSVEELAGTIPDTVNEVVEIIEKTGQAQVSNVQKEGAAQVRKIDITGAENVSAVNAAGDAKIKAVNDAGAAQTEAVNDAGTKQVADINTAGDIQEKRVSDEGTTQVQAVNDVGAQQTDAIRQEGAVQLAYLTDAGGGIEAAISNYYALRRTGKVYQAKIWKFAANPTSVGEKLLDNAGLVCEPSTDTIEGRDDYADIPLFQWCHVNYIRDDNGDAHPIAIEGQGAYKTSGAVDVGSMQMSFWWDIDTSNAEYDLWTISDTPHPELGLVPYPAAVRVDGTVAPYIIHSAYVSGIAEDGLLRSQPGLKPERKQSHNSMIDDYQKKGSGYWGAGAERNTFQVLFNIIKYANKSSQATFAGCTLYSVQYVASIERDTTDTYFPVTNAQAANIPVGTYVSVGYGANINNAVDTDRVRDTMHAYADNVKVLRIEALDDSNKAVYLDIEDGFNTTPVALTEDLISPITLSSMHSRSGFTDKVIGHHDGSPVSNTNGKYPYRIQGLEYAVGGYIVTSDTVASFKADGSKDVYVAKKGTLHSKSDSVIRSTYAKIGNIPALENNADFYVGDIAVDLQTGGWFPSSVGGGSTQGFADRCYGGGAYSENNTREYLQGGNLWYGSAAGSAFLHCGGGLGLAYWHYLSCD